MRLSDFPNLGFGLGLRNVHYNDYLTDNFRDVSWVEAITETYMPWRDGRVLRSLAMLERVREKLPVALHGVSMSLGAAAPLDASYLARLKDLVDRIQPAWISDHLCWTGMPEHNLHDLLPIPYTKEALRIVSEKILQVEQTLGRRILVENVSSYVEFQDSEMSEWEFLAELVERADCGLLLDVNNIYVSSVNHGFDPYEYLRAIPAHRVGQIHLAGHRNKGGYLIDTHDEPVCDEVWKLYRWTCEHVGAVSTMIEWDADIPELDELTRELDKARKVFQQVEDARDAGRAAASIQESRL